VRPLAALVLLVVLGGCRESFGVRAQPTASVIRDWNRTLSEVVDDSGRVDFDALEAQRGSLDRFVAWIARGDGMQGKKKADRHPFWLNAWNALVLFQILERGRPDDLRDVDGWMPGPATGFFVETQFEVGPDWLSLAEIRDERLRLRELNFRDHSAMYSGRRDGPPMRPELYVKHRLRDQLIDQMHSWVRHPTRGVTIEDGEVVFPIEFDWYAWDFAFTTNGLDICEIAARQAGEARENELRALSKAGCPNRFRPADWRLDDASAD
jgi:hypothetical protein